LELSISNVAFHDLDVNLFIPKMFKPR